MVSADLMKHMLANLSAAGIDRQIKHEILQGYPHATKAERQMIFDAGKKAGSPPHDLHHARAILADNVFAFRPAHNSPFNRAGHYWACFVDHWPRPDGPRRSL